VSTTVIVTPFGVAQQLAAACVLSNISGTIVPIGEFSGIVLADTDVKAGNEAAAAISKLAGKHEVLLLVRSEEQIDAGHFRHGSPRIRCAGRTGAEEPARCARRTAARNRCRR
jgi:hypothetical protein